MSGSNRSEDGDSDFPKFDLRDLAKKTTTASQVSNPEDFTCFTEGEVALDLEIVIEEDPCEAAINWMKNRGIEPGFPEKYAEEHRHHTKKIILSLKSCHKTEVEGVRLRESSLYNKRRARPSNLHLRRDQ